jgi:hypothetical protein
LQGTLRMLYICRVKLAHIMKTTVSIIVFLSISSVVLAFSESFQSESNADFTHHEMEITISGNSPSSKVQSQKSYTTLNLFTTKQDTVSGGSENVSTSTEVTFPNFLEIFFQFENNLIPSNNSNHEH